MNDKFRLGIYAGSFNPFHIGHLDIVNQASKVFDNVMVARGINPEKSNVEPFPYPVHFLTRMGLYVRTYKNLLSDFIKEQEKEGFDVTLIRGLRSGADLEYEQNFSAFLKGMYPQVKIIAFYCDPRYRHISSSALRAIRTFSEDEYKKYVISD